jgi:Uma2 family endonuclease
VLLLIEAADSSLDYDCNLKRPLYARAGIPEFWIVDLVAREVEVCRSPAGGDYAEVSRVGLVADT